MSKYAAEQVESAAEIMEQNQNAPSWKRLSAMLRDYAALLRERESAKAAVTDEIVRIASDARYVAITGDSPAPPNRCEESDAAMRAALEAVAPMLASAADNHLEQEQDDIDRILAKLGLTANRARTECGYLRVNDILNHIQETLDALAEANSARIAMTDKYVKLASARVPEGWKMAPIEPTDAMCEAAWDCDAADYVGEHKCIRRADLAYKAMLAAAPMLTSARVPDSEWLELADVLDKFTPTGGPGPLWGAGASFAYSDAAKTIRAKLAAATKPEKE